MKQGFLRFRLASRAVTKLSCRAEKCGGSARQNELPFLSLLATDGIFYVSCGNAGEENALSGNTSISAAPFKNCIFVSKQFLFIIATALLQVVFQAGEAAAAVAWHRAV